MPAETEISWPVTAASRALLADPLDPDYIELRDDFIGGGLSINQGNATIGELGWASIALFNLPVVDWIDSIADHPGIFRIASATATNDGGLITFTGLANSEAGRLPPVVALTGWRLVFIARLSSAANVALQIGLLFDTNGVPAAHGIYWQFDTAAGDTLFSAVCRSAGTETKTPSLVAGNTSWNKFEIFCNTAGTISFSINGGTAINIAANVPTIAMTPVFRVQTRTTASKSLDIDFFGAAFQVSR